MTQYPFQKKSTITVLLAACWLMSAGLEAPLQAANSSAVSSIDSSRLPAVFTDAPMDIINLQLKQQAALAFQMHQLPQTRQEWEVLRTQLKATVLRKTGAIIDHALPLNYKETGHTQLNGYSVKNIVFQTRPGVYATANLYVPDGKGPFPAVINSHGHWKDARAGEMVQATAHALALNGYVCLNMDAWGAGERTTIHGEAEYHGANLGASLMDIGTSLMGMQLTDNMRGVDLLCSLPQVDKDHIGATGASGGGNQTMWLSAMDERIKAVVPVVSVGTFESYIMNSNCVCELLADGLTFTEEAGILGLIAPRALKICNALNDSNKSFYPSEMLRSYKNAASVFDLLGASDKLSYQLFNTTHGYWPEIRETMVGWFDLHLKGTGTGAPKKEPAFTLLPVSQLMTFPAGKRDAGVMSTAAFCKLNGQTLRQDMLEAKGGDKQQQQQTLKEILRIQDPLTLKTLHRYSTSQGWERLALETTSGDVIPVLLRAPQYKEKGFVILSHPRGKDSIPADILEAAVRDGNGIVLPDLWGTGEHGSALANTTDGSLPPFHTLSRSALWLGNTVQGQWVNELDLVTKVLKSQFGAGRITIDGSRETGIAALFLAALEGNVTEVTLRNGPLSYAFDERSGIDFFTMAVHVPGFLQWGDVSQAAALSGKEIRFIDPVTMAGKPVKGSALDTYKAEFEKLRKRYRTTGHTIFQ
ncbi:alpha/beta hydrolase family protein [Chitinophaga defluvii]|uniref:Acetylxylan esterase n=1 Tax=Chitinophaga defluvii TaxID=3163343 RepID=A0ABV2T3E8_9BACT